MVKEMIYEDEADLRKNRSATGAEAVRAVTLLRLSSCLTFPCNMECYVRCLCTLVEACTSGEHSDLEIDIPLLCLVFHH